MEGDSSVSAHRMALEQETREGRLTGYSHAWCSCGGFDMRGPAVDVAAQMLGHQCSSQPEGVRVSSS